MRMRDVWIMWEWSSVVMIISITNAIVQATYVPRNIQDSDNNILTTVLLVYVELAQARSNNDDDHNASLVLLLALSIDCFCNVKAQRCKESRFLDRGQMASGDTFPTDRHTHARTTVSLV